MISQEKVYEGLKVGDAIEITCPSSEHKGLRGTLIAIDYASGRSTQTIDGVTVMYHKEWLRRIDPIDPPAPQRVEVVTETREVAKEVVLRLPVSVAKELASIVGISAWDECRDELRAAIAAQEAKS